MTESPRYSADDLIDFATQLGVHAGLPAERAHSVAFYLVEADLMGHSTHGLNLLGPYLREVEQGSMATEGEPTVLADHGAAVTWDGRYLPGPWLVEQAMNLAFERIETNPIVTVVIRRSHHIASLAAFPERATQRGLFMLLTCSDPNDRSVAPFGGLRALYTPNPLAAGIPTEGEPIIIDISMSNTANGYVARYFKDGERMPGPWMLDNQGNPSDDPAVMLAADPPGTILPLGGMDLGYKGFALGLLVETLTSALGGHGRADPPGPWGASVFLQVIDPAAFGGLESFTRQTQWLAEASRANPVKPGNPPVRLPGSRGLHLRAEQRQHGLELYPTIMPALLPWAEKFGVTPPAPLA